MNPEQALIIICLILITVIIGYTVYRLFTDKEKAGKKNILYPLNSNPNDPILPESSNKLEWFAYIVIILSILGMIYFAVVEVRNIGENTQSNTILYITQAMFLIGVACIVISKLSGKK